MVTLARGVSYIDLHLKGVPRTIATAVLAGPDGIALVDPGPSTTLPILRAALERDGIAFSDITTLLLTHIHLDHAGACGTLVRSNPKLRVYVHEKGAPHLVDPEKLVASATRLWADEMETLWGEILPVPPGNLVVLAGGERLSAGGRDLEVAYTPGHASHHVSFFTADAGIAFVGDTAGVRLRPGGYLLPPTPPPDIDLEAWHASIARIGQWRPETLFITHFGPSAPGPAHLSEYADQLDRFAAVAKRVLTDQIPDAEREARFIEEIGRELRQALDPADVEALELMARLDLSWRGIERYWRKRPAASR